MFRAPKRPRHDRNHEAQRIYLMTPWGQVAVIDLTSEELDIIDDLISMTGDPFEKVVADIAKDRFYARYGGGF